MMLVIVHTDRIITMALYTLPRGLGPPPLKPFIFPSFLVRDMSPQELGHIIEIDG